MVQAFFNLCLFIATGSDEQAEYVSVRACPAACSALIVVMPDVRYSRRFHHNLCQPRAPRHRSERPTSFSVENLAITEAAIDAIVHDDSRRSALVTASVLSPLCGHPLELLRPPSAIA
jgi:hypothetical protein